MTSYVGIAHLFHGSVVNVSGWRDVDKQGNTYRSYFSNASEYCITNYQEEKTKGYQGDIGNEIPLDLKAELPSDLDGRFDVVFNHTVLEHVFEVNEAFANLCRMTKDIVIVVVPFLQHQHARKYGDFWRFTPTVLKVLFEKNGLSLVYLSFNDSGKEAIYLFAVGSRQPEAWTNIRDLSSNRVVHILDKIGLSVVRQSTLYRIRAFFLHKKAYLARIVRAR